MVLPTVGWDSSHQLIESKPSPRDSVTGQPNLGNQSSKRLSSWVILDGMKLAVKTPTELNLIVELSVMFWSFSPPSCYHWGQRDLPPVIVILDDLTRDLVYVGTQPSDWACPQPRGFLKHLGQASLLLLHFCLHSTVGEVAFAFLFFYRGPQEVRNDGLGIIWSFPGTHSLVYLGGPLNP